MDTHIQNWVSCWYEKITFIDLDYLVFINIDDIFMIIACMRRTILRMMLNPICMLIGKPENLKYVFTVGSR